MCRIVLLVCLARNKEDHGEIPLPCSSIWRAVMQKITYSLWLLRAGLKPVGWNYREVDQAIRQEEFPSCKSCLALEQSVLCLTELFLFGSFQAEATYLVLCDAVVVVSTMQGVGLTSLFLQPVCSTWANLAFDLHELVFRYNFQIRHLARSSLKINLGYFFIIIYISFIAYYVNPCFNCSCYCRSTEE